MAIVVAFGQRSEIHFDQFLRNEAIEPALFRFEPPVEADVVGVPARTD